MRFYARFGRPHGPAQLRQPETGPSAGATANHGSGITGERGTLPPCLSRPPPMPSSWADARSGLLLEVNHRARGVDRAKPGGADRHAPGCPAPRGGSRAVSPPSPGSHGAAGSALPPRCMWFTPTVTTSRWKSTPGGNVEVGGRELHRGHLPRHLGTQGGPSRPSAIWKSRLRQSQKLEAVGQLAGGVAHDFNNLLTAISGNVEILEPILIAEREAAEALGTIREAVRQAAGVTRSLLTFSSRIPTGEAACGASRPGAKDRPPAPAHGARNHHRDHRPHRRTAAVAICRSHPAPADHHQPGDQCAGCDARRWDDPYRLERASR